MKLKPIFLSFLLTFIFLSFPLTSQISIVAHRGASAYELENSIAAFKKAFELNADAIELDVWKSKDDSLIVMHDQMTGRTANKNLNISTSTAKELRDLQLKNGEQIPFLQDVLDILPEGKKVVIEIKDENEKNAKKIISNLSSILKRSGKEKNAVIISFHLPMLIEAKKQLPHLKCYYLSSEKNKENELIAICKKYNFDGLDVHYKILTENLVKKAKEAGLDVWTWTVDDPKIALFAQVNNKVSAITTNCPDVISDILEKNNYQTIYYEQKRSIYKILPRENNEIIFLGNSITDYGEWPEFFQNSKIKNRGISGDITLGILARLNDILVAQPSKIFLLIGINDISKNNPDSIILYNYQMIIEEILEKSPTTQLYIQSILPINNDFKKYPRLQNKEKHILFLNKKLKELCQEKNLTYIDLFSAFCNDKGQLKPEFTNDGLHLTGEGYKMWIEILKPYVNENKSVTNKLFETPYYMSRLKAHRQEKTRANNIVFLGNSITEQGWWSILLKNEDVVNRGIGGDNTYGILHRLPEILQTKPKKIFLMAGINDITAGRNITEIILNFEKIIEVTQAVSPQTQLYIQSVLPVNDTSLTYNELKGKNPTIVQLNSQLKKLCEEKNIPYIDIASLLSDEKGQLKANLTKDGIHLQPEAYIIWTDYLKKMNYL